MEFYGVLQLYITRGQEHLFLPVEGYFNLGDEVEIILLLDDGDRPKALCLRKADRSNISKFLKTNKSLSRVEKTKDGLWISIPRWAWEASGYAGSFYVGLDGGNFSEDGMPREVLLLPVPVPKELVMEQKDQKRLIMEQRLHIETKRPELQVVDINRGKKKAGSPTKREMKADLSEDMLTAAFGDEFDTSIGIPKEVR